ncbi:MAG: M20/M25/M40 family metallo-hydrolase [Clostridia bacterium]|nr:M20/M25/M40 family metallo-hydrolase [Clostridia bacterium]
MAYIVSNEAKAALEALLSNDKVARAVAFAEADQPRCLEEHIRLTEIEAPTYHEQARAEAFAELLRGEGLENVHIGKGGNVIGTLKGAAPGKAVLVDAHLDTVFPFGSVTKVREENGVLYAPGICDDTRALAMMLSCIRALKAADITTRRDVIFLGSTREEGSGSMGGMVDFLSEHQDEIECCISVDSSALQNIIYCATGLRTVEFTFRGIGGHAYSAFGDVAQPVHAAARVAAAIADLQVPSDPKTTFAVSNFHAGNKASMHAIPAECSIIVNYRSNDPATLEWLHNQIFAIVEKACADETARWGKDVISWSHEVHCDVPAGSQDAHAPLVEGLAAIIEHMGCRTTLMPGGATNCNITIARGIPSVCMGMTWSPDSTHVPTLDHTLAEWFPIEGAYKGVQALILLLLGKAGVA